MFDDYPIGETPNRYLSSYKKRARSAPRNEAASLVYKLLLYADADVPGMNVPYVVEALEVLTYYGKAVSVTAVTNRENAENEYRLRVTNKDW